MIMQCPKCGAEINERSDYCGLCLYVIPADYTMSFVRNEKNRIGETSFGNVRYDMENELFISGELKPLSTESSVSKPVDIGKPGRPGNTPVRGAISYAPLSRKLSDKMIDRREAV